MKCVCGSSEFIEEKGQVKCKKCSIPQKKKYRSLYTDPFGGETTWKKRGGS